MQDDLRNALSTINTSIEDQGGKIENNGNRIAAMQDTVGKLDALIQAPEKLFAPVSRSVGEEMAKVAIASFREQVGNGFDLEAFQQDLQESRDGLLHVRAINENKKIIEKDGQLEMVDKNYWDHTVDVVVPVAKAALGTMAGIALWEGGRAVVDWVRSDDGDEPINV